MAQAESHFANLEIDIARSSLWKAANDKKALIGEMIAHKTPGKTHKNLVYITKAMKILKEKSMVPLLLAPSDIFKMCPAFHCDKGDTNAVDVMSKVKVLEESMDNFMKQQGEQMRNLTETIGNISHDPRPRPPVVDSRVHDQRKDESSIRSRSVSPSKRARVEEPNENVENNDNNTKISAHADGVLAPGSAHARPSARPPST